MDYFKEITPYYNQIIEFCFPDVPSDLALLKSILHGGRLLELGVGTGIISKYFSKEGFLVTGLDISSPMLEYANNEAYHNVTLSKQDAREFKFRNRFNHIISYEGPLLLVKGENGFEVETYWESTEDTKKALKNIHNSLFNRGTFILNIKKEREPANIFDIGDGLFYKVDIERVGSTVNLTHNVYDENTQLVAQSKIKKTRHSIKDFIDTLDNQGFIGGVNIENKVYRTYKS